MQYTYLLCVHILISPCHIPQHSVHAYLLPPHNVAVKIMVLYRLAKRMVCVQAIVL